MEDRQLLVRAERGEIVGNGQQQVALLVAELAKAGDHRLVLAEGGVSGIDRCHRALNRQEVIIRLLKAEVAELRTPSYYWDDRDLDSALDPSEVGEGDDPGDVIALRPIHELPAVWVLVLPAALQWFDTAIEAAEAAGEKHPTGSQDEGDGEPKHPVDPVIPSPCPLNTEEPRP